MPARALPISAAAMARGGAAALIGVTVRMRRVSAAPTARPVIAPI